jgi:hypothetical protein
MASATSRLALLMPTSVLMEVMALNKNSISGRVWGGSQGSRSRRGLREYDASPINEERFGNSASLLIFEGIFKEVASSSIKRLAEEAASQETKTLRSQPLRESGHQLLQIMSG